MSGISASKLINIKDMNLGWGKAYNFYTKKFPLGKQKKLRENTS
jgi:hypothetical protein